MNFIVDAQLPKSLARFLREKGHDAIHTLELPDKNKTDDRDINQLSLSEKRVVISKDSDFYDRYFLKLEPYKLLYLTTGNIPNKDLIKIFEKNLTRIIVELETNFVVELTRNSIITIE